ncbi:RHS repeat domain-containing protein [Chryseobacterium sp. YR221]|uniref:RHS repeat domain-containing protein n=1 Tax=Chryseobacterium sp. YR221 TaxID=1500293 RepID=UPI0009D89D9E|nr:RHS repeat domain-containing protein [Chryseobacterium sp. YR221]SMC56153.1 YD repeat-containing protein [Chryseobacterium sp. YR221]
MKKILIWVGISISQILYSQSNNIGNKLSNIIPPSIDNYNFVKYGKLSVSNNSGGFNHTIPLYTLNDGTLNTNLSLSYYNDGVKVNDIAGVVGMNWNLSTGGMITRIVRDQPDEYSQGYTFRPESNEIVDILNGNYDDTYYLQNVKEKALLLYKSGVKTDEMGDYSKVDNEQDWFSFNFDGYSGTFFIDNDKVYINSNVEGIKAKVEKDIVYGPKVLKFIFTMPDGKTYRFGGHSDFIETSETITACSKNYGLPVASTWFLQEINYNNSSIFFKYKNHWKEYPYDYSESVTIGNIIPINTGCPSYPKFNECLTSFKSSTAKAISEIYSESSKILFNYQENREDYNQGIFLKKIEVYNLNNKVKTINFNYFYSSSPASQLPAKIANQGNVKKRLFLEEIDFGNNEKYKFEYNKPNLLPARLSYQQDNFGYANGNNFASLLNINDFDNDNYFKTVIKNSFSNVDKANRSINPTISKYGSLVKIIYPTKGYTLINYENNITTRRVEKTSFSSEGLSNEFRCTGVGTNTSYTSDFSFVANGSKIYIDNFLSESVCEGVYVDPKSSHNLRIENISKGKVLYTGTTNQDTTFESKESTVAWPGTPTKFVPIKTINGDTYKITYKSTVKYSEGAHTLGIEYNFITTPVDEEVNYSGLRVASLEDFDGVKSEVRNFKYNDLPNITDVKTSLNHVFEFNPWDFSCVFYNCGSGGSTSVENNCRNTISFSSTNYQNSLNSRSNRISYEYLTELRPLGGAIVNKYWIDNVDNAPLGIVNASPKGTVNSNMGASMRGRLLESNYYDNNGNILKKIVNSYLSQIKNVFYNYNFDFNISPYPNLLNLDLDHVYNNTTVANGCTTLICNLQGKLNGDMYRNVIESYLLKNQQEISYLNNIPIKTETEYFYNNPLHYQVTLSKNLFPDNTIQETAYSYAHEKGNQKLIAANMIGIPLETIVTKRKNANDSTGKMLSKTETKYDDPATLFPTSVISYGINTGVQSTEITYDKYDSKGNLLQYTTKDGVPTVIIWGYNNTRPIAKVEGLTYAQISSNISVIVNASDVDGAAGSNNDETALLDAFKAFRAQFPNSPVTTYTYDPLIGVRSITPPTGITEFYTYDAAGRLEKVADANGKVLKEMKYNYKN